MWHGEGGDGQGLSFSDLSGGDQRPSRGRSAGSKLLLCPMAPLCKGSCLRSRLRGRRLTARGSGLPAWWGRSPLGVSFERAKETKTRLGRSRRRKHGLTPCGAVVGAVACPARGYPGIAPGDSGGASPSPTTGHRESGQSKGLHSSFFIHHYSFDSSPSAQGWPPGPRTRYRPGGYSAGPASPRRPRWWGACR